MDDSKTTSSTLIKLGPGGSSSSGDDAWDEQRKITQIFISYGKYSVTSLQFQYKEGGKLALSPVYGNSKHDSPKFSTITLKDYTEYITGLTGYCTGRLGFGFGLCNDEEEYTWISSFTIETNKRKYGPFGHPGQKSRSGDDTFEFQIGPGNQFGGFYGSFGCVPVQSGIDHEVALTSIGVYLKPS
ncbi:inactive protein RESTRICTED TEV MOVEMENT 1-like [Spinacia oleracea]|uniref:Inactive protein RESTRICTED TEV MOVEMENT 1-like n=1 Tax=Spinacia oleracea TaxID=3562 RepID=A0A9R0K9D7_SPIOL|nr:inactive protein RESTRICTED TEV MOVEMENT 1-like [Spinacia oleracea]